MRLKTDKLRAFLEKYETVEFVRSNKRIILFSAVLLAGMISGALSVESIKPEAIGNLDLLFSSDFYLRSERSGGYAFISSLSSSFLFCAAVAFFSASFFGPVVIPSIVLFRGFGVGVSAGYLYLAHGLKGVAFYVLVTLPGTFLSSIALILISDLSIEFSMKVAGKFLPRGGDANLYLELKEYLKKLGRFFVPLCAAALLDMIFTAAFSRFFDF